MYEWNQLRLMVTDKEIDQAKSEYDAAYWNFTRSRQGNIGPVLEKGDIYRALKEKRSLEKHC